MTVLVVEDEPSFVDALTIGLEREGFTVHSATDGASGLRMASTVDPDIILLDVMLPKLSGIDVCRELRAAGNRTPIIMITAKGAEIDTVVGLEVGADDYVTKPYRVRELVARMRAVMRRSEGQPISADAPEVDAYEIGDVRLEPHSHVVKVRDEVVDLPLKEFELLEMLMANVGRVVSRDQLIDEIWGSDYVGDTKTLDVHIKRLRAKIERDPTLPESITTVRGLGYKYEKQ